MANVKLAIIYYSATGTNHQLAQWAEEGAEKAGAEVQVVRIEETAPDEAIESNEAWKAHAEKSKDVPTATLDILDWADAYIFSIPTRYGNMPSQVQSFIDTTGGLWFENKLANKVVSAMSSAMNPHGGQESTIQSLYKTMCHWGAIIVPPGYTDQSIFAAGGNPYGTSVTVDQEGNMQEEVRDAVIHQAKRTVKVARWLKQGRNVASKERADASAS